LESHEIKKNSGATGIEPTTSGLLDQRRGHSDKQAALFTTVTGWSPGGEVRLWNARAVPGNRPAMGVFSPTEHEGLT